MRWMAFEQQLIGYLSDCCCICEVTYIFVVRFFGMPTARSHHEFATTPTPYVHRRQVYNTHGKGVTAARKAHVAVAAPEYFQHTFSGSGTKVLEDPSLPINVPQVHQTVVGIRVLPGLLSVWCVAALLPGSSTSRTVHSIAEDYCKASDHHPRLMISVF